MDRWLSYAKNKAVVACPIPHMHENDREHYCKRILERYRIAQRIDDNEYADLSELYILQQKYVTIANDFEDLYRKTMHIPVEQQRDINIKIIRQCK